MHVNNLRYLNNRLIKVWFATTGGGMLLPFLFPLVLVTLGVSAHSILQSKATTLYIFTTVDYVFRF